MKIKNNTSKKTPILNLLLHILQYKSIGSVFTYYFVNIHFVIVSMTLKFLNVHLIL